MIIFIIHATNVKKVKINKVEKKSSINTKFKYLLRYTVKIQYCNGIKKYSNTIY